MALQLKQSLQLILSQDSGTVPRLKIADFDEAFTDATSVNEGGALVHRINTGVTDAVVSLGSVAAAKGLAIIADKAVSIKFNDIDGTNRSLTLVPNKTSVIHANFTALYLSNATGDTSYVRYVVWGD
jgi:hypothetical protein